MCVQSKTSAHSYAIMTHVLQKIDSVYNYVHTCNLPMLGLLIVLTVSLLVVFKVETNNMPTCSVFINNCSLTDAPLASSSKD